MAEPLTPERMLRAFRSILVLGGLVCTLVFLWVHSSTQDVGRALMWTGVAAIPIAWWLAVLHPASSKWAVLPLALSRGPGVMARLRFYVNGRVERIVSLAEQLSAGECEEMERLVAEVQREGFVTEGTFKMSEFNSTAGSVMYVVMLVHPHRRHHASVAHAPYRGVYTQIQVDFGATVGDKRVIANNSLPPSMFGLGTKPPSTVGLPFLKIESVAELYKVFQGVVAIEQRSEHCKPPPSDWEQELRDNTLAMYKNWERCGYFRQVGEGEYAVTRRGALRSGWGMTPGIVELRRAREWRYFARERRKLGL